MKTIQINSVPAVQTLDSMISDAAARQEDIAAHHRAVELGKFLAKSGDGISKFKQVDFIQDLQDLRITYKLFRRMKSFVGKKKTEFQSLGGYSYRRGANHNFGSSSHVTAILLGEEKYGHETCEVCRKSSKTVVNGVCLPCTKN